MSAHSSAFGDETAARAASPTLPLAVLIAATLAVRLAAAAVVPLTEDEAYYRLWSLRPAFGYFDHPPMVAWWIWLGRHVAGDTPLGVRLVPSLAAAATTLVTFDVARLAGFGERVALRAAIWLNATILVGLGAMLAVPDAPTGLFWMLTLWCAFKATRGQPAWWLAAGAAAGLACLSKYSALFLAPGLLLWLATSRAGRRTLASPWPWFAAVVAAAVLAPNVVWNAQHGWMTFAKQFGRVASGGFAPTYLAKLVLDQFALLNPLIAIFLGLAAWRRIGAPLLLVSAPFVLYLMVHSLHGEVQGQWPAPLYPSLAICAAAAAEGVTAGSLLGRLRAVAAPLGFGACAAALTFIVAPAGVALPFKDPMRAYRDWPAFAGAVERDRQAAGAAWVGAPDYGLAARLASATQIKAPGVQIFERQRYTFEAPGEHADFTRPGVVVLQVNGPQAAAIRQCFAEVAALPNIERGQGKNQTTFQVFRVAQPRRDIERDGCVKPG